MSIDGGTEAAIIGAGAALLLGVGAGLVRAAGLRGEVNQKWSTRIDLAAVALDEKTVDELKHLREAIEGVMPADGVGFDPALAIVDPAPLSTAVERTAEYYRTRVGMKRHLRRLRATGRVAIGGFLGLGLAIVLLVLHYAQLDSAAWTKAGGFIVGVMTAVVLIGDYMVYAWCEDRLANSEILAESAGIGQGARHT